MKLEIGRMNYPIGGDVDRIIRAMVWDEDPEKNPNACGYNIWIVPYGQQPLFTIEELDKRAMPAKIWIDNFSKEFGFYPIPDKEYIVQVDYYPAAKVW